MSAGDVIAQAFRPGGEVEIRVDGRPRPLEHDETLILDQTRAGTKVWIERGGQRREFPLDNGQVLTAAAGAVKLGFTKQGGVLIPIDPMLEYLERKPGQVMIDVPLSVALEVCRQHGLHYDGDAGRLRAHGVDTPEFADVAAPTDEQASRFGVGAEAGGWRRAKMAPGSANRLAEAIGQHEAGQIILQPSPGEMVLGVNEEEKVARWFTVDAWENLMHDQGGPEGAGGIGPESPADKTIEGG